LLGDLPDRERNNGPFLVELSIRYWAIVPILVLMGYFAHDRKKKRLTSLLFTQLLERSLPPLMNSTF